VLHADQRALALMEQFWPGPGLTPWRCACRRIQSL
jgi:hypothetical protein